MKRLCSMFLALLLVGCLTTGVLAADGQTIPLTGSKDSAYVVDQGELLSDSEEATLNDMAKEISQRQECDVIILTVQDVGGQNIEDFATNYFDSNALGRGSQRSGILFVISASNREWCIDRHGEGIAAFSDAKSDELWKKSSNDFSGGNYMSGFKTFLQNADKTLSAYRKHGPGILKTTVIALLIGFVIAFFMTTSLRAELKSVRSKYSASSYRRPDSLRLDTNRDIYLYTNTRSRVIETQQRDGGNGSTTHVTASGTTHATTSGKF